MKTGKITAMLLALCMIFTMFAAVSVTSVSAAEVAPSFSDIAGQPYERSVNVLTSLGGQKGTYLICQLLRLVDDFGGDLFPHHPSGSCCHVVRATTKIIQNKAEAVTKVAVSCFAPKYAE